jgi:hypothetical protein
MAAPVTPAAARGVDKRAAAIHFQRGRALFEVADWPAALDEFNAGYAAYPLPGFLVNIGQCLRKLDRLDEATAAFQRFLDAGGDPRLRAEVQEALSQMAEERAPRQPASSPPPEPAAASARVDLSPAPTPAPAVSPAPLAATTSLTAAPLPPKKKKTKKWVWAVVGVLAAGAVGAAVGVTVLETQPQSPRPGSLGVLDGRR